jgi:hypothetical protein
MRIPLGCASRIEMYDVRHWDTEVPDPGYCFWRAGHGLHDHCVRIVILRADPGLLEYALDWADGTPPSRYTFSGRYEVHWDDDASSPQSDSKE